MDEIIECPHASIRKSKYMLEGRVVLACNNCNPREMIEGPITKVLTTDEIRELDAILDVANERDDSEEDEEIEPDEWLHVPILHVPPESEAIPAFDAERALAKRALSLNDEIKKILATGPVGFEATYPRHIASVEEAQRVVDVKTETLRMAMLNANAVEGLTWDQIARITGKKSGQAAYQYATFKSTKKAKESKS